MTGHGVDRIDNGLGYVRGNILPCCGHCNSLKQDLLSTYETVEVVKILKRMRKTTKVWEHTNKQRRENGISKRK